MENNLGRIVEDLRYIPYIYEQKKNIIIHNLDEDINQFVIENSKDLIVLESQSASINAYDSFISLPKNPIIFISQRLSNYRGHYELRVSGEATSFRLGKIKKLETYFERKRNVVDNSEDNRISLRFTIEKYGRFDLECTNILSAYRFDFDEKKEEELMDSFAGG